MIKYSFLQNEALKEFTSHESSSEPDFIYFHVNFVPCSSIKTISAKLQASSNMQKF